jgi:hypothetical protein
LHACTRRAHLFEFERVGLIPVRACFLLFDCRLKGAPLHKNAAKGVERTDGANAGRAYVLAALDVNNQVGLWKRAIVKGLRLIHDADVVVDKAWRPIDCPPRIKGPPRDLEGNIGIIRSCALFFEIFSLPLVFLVMGLYWGSGAAEIEACPASIEKDPALRSGDARSGQGSCGQRLHFARISRLLHSRLGLRVQGAIITSSISFPFAPFSLMPHRMR